MRDCKLINLYINIAFTSREVNKFVDNGNTVRVCDVPAFEKALNPYLKQGYRIVQMDKFDGAFFSVLLERDN